MGGCLDVLESGSWEVSGHLLKLRSHAFFNQKGEVGNGGGDSMLGQCGGITVNAPLPND